MTTIILTIIGILLAAAAALMVIFYGGDAFNSGSVGAKANTLQNAGTNVESAATLYKTEKAGAASTVQDLIDNDYLKEAPALTGIGSGPGVLATVTNSAAVDVRVFQVSGVAGEVCAKVNSNLSTSPLAAGDGKMGCVEAADPADPGVFFAAL